MVLLKLWLIFPDDDNIAITFELFGSFISLTDLPIISESSPAVIIRISVKLSLSIKMLKFEFISWKYA